MRNLLASFVLVLTLFGGVSSGEYALFSASIYDEQEQIAVPVVIKIDKTTGEAWLLKSTDFLMPVSGFSNGATFNVVGWYPISASFEEAVAKLVGMSATNAP